MIGLAAISLCLSLIGLLVFRWDEMTIWFVLGVGKPPFVLEPRYL
jgi:hypothetical protein